MIYEQSIKMHRLQSHARLNKNLACWEALRDKDSQYAFEVKALGSLHRRVAKIWINAPDTLDGKEGL